MLAGKCQIPKRHMISYCLLVNSTYTVPCDRLVNIRSHLPTNGQYICESLCRAINLSGNGAIELAQRSVRNGLAESSATPTQENIINELKCASWSVGIN